MVYLKSILESWVASILQSATDVNVKRNERTDVVAELYPVQPNTAIIVLRTTYKHQWAYLWKQGWQGD